VNPLPWHIFTLPQVYQIVGFLLVLFLVLWVVHVQMANASLADMGFCLGFGLVVVACGMNSEGSLWRRILVGGMGSAYAFRLGWHLWKNRIWRKTEDSRYQILRAVLGKRESVGILGYFLLQVPACLFFGGLLCWIMAHPQSAVRGWDLLGLGIFVFAFLGEALADIQLEQFRSDPTNQGKVLQRGLWRFSRHPNYFFEILQWCAYVPLAVGLTGAWMAIVWPFIMMSSLLWVTGVPLAEAQAMRSRGEAYRLYQRTTNKLIPWLPRRNR
jgi:steroid 5-alpha reductase family enzyme